MDASPTLIHLDHPGAVPLGRQFLVRGWVAASRPIRSVHLGGPGFPRLTIVERDDVRAAHPDYAHVAGFSGTATTDEIKGGTIRIHCVLDGVPPAELEKDLPVAEVPGDKAARLARIRPHLRTDLPFEETPFHFDFLSDALRKRYGVFETDNVSGFGYAGRVQRIIDRFPDGLVLDCGAGCKAKTQPNVVNFEIVPYPSTDVLGVAEQLPFNNHTFDAVVSCAVLEHLRDPFQAAREMIRVTRPGGVIVADVPFLQPYHGYPAHYYNMTSQGLANLFADHCDIEEVSVPDYGTPIWALTWFLNSYLAGLPPTEREKFADLRVKDLVGHADTYREAAFVRELSRDKNFELACTTSVVAVVRKPPAGG